VAGLDRGGLDAGGVLSGGAFLLGLIVGAPLAFGAPETTAFKAWHNDVVSRLEEYYRALPEDAQPLFSADGYVMDPPVARETFNPDVPFNPESAAVLIDRYLRALNYEENRFLRTPEDLQEMEFEGHPYRFPPNPPQPGEGA